MKKNLSLLFLLFSVFFTETIFAQCGGGASISVGESRCVATGTITVNGASGAGPFQYSFSSYPVDYAYSGPSSSNAFTALNPGTYDLVVTDLGSGCSTTYPGVVVPGSYIEPDYNVTPTAVTGCYNGTNGSISGTLSNGRAPFYYQIMSGPMGVGTTSVSGTFTNLGPGDYEVRGFDSCGNFQTRQATIDNFFWSLASNTSTKTNCGQYTLDAVSLNNPPTGVTYFVKQGGSVLASGTSLPISFNNPDATIGSVTVCATDACGHEECQPLSPPADWSISVATTTYPSCHTFSVDQITITGTPIGPIMYGFVRADQDTVWSSTVPFTFPKVGFTQYFWGQEIVKDGCGVVKSQPDYYQDFMDIWGGGYVSFTSCNDATIVANVDWRHIDPVSYSLNGGAPQASGNFTNQTDGNYTVTITDACGDTKELTYSLDHNWSIDGGQEPYCDLGLYRNYVSVNRRMKAPITYQQWDATYTTLVSSQSYTDPSGMWDGNYGFTDWFTTVDFYNAQPGATYNYIVTDDCGRKDTVTIVNPTPGHVPNTVDGVVTPLCVNKGNIVANYSYDGPTWNSILISLWNINTPGSPLVTDQNLGTTTIGAYTFTDIDTGTYVIKIKPQYCNEITYDTVVVPKYKLPKLRKSIAFNCGGNTINCVGSGKFGIKPYTYEIWQTIPAGGEQPVQSSNVFSLTGSYTLIRMRLVDACGNTSLQDMAVRAPSPLSIKALEKIPLCNQTTLDLYVDSSLTGATYEWKDPSGAVIGSGPQVQLTSLTTADTGTYTCHITIAGTCYDVTTPFRLRAKDLGCYAQLGNYVWLDADKNGVQDANEVGVAGVTVTLYDATNNVVGATVTDAYGYYLFTQLNPGDYHVGFTPPSNYVLTGANAGANDLLDSDPNTSTGMTGVYTLVAGDSNMTVDAGIYLDQPSTASLGNYVWNDLNHDGIQDANELGISGVTVTLYDGSGNPIATTVTDASGYYYFTNLTPGTYSLGFTQPIGYIFSPQDAGSNDATDSDVNPATGKTGTVTLAAGENNLTIDAGVYSQDAIKASLGNYVWYDNDHDGIQDANEAGVAGVTVTLYDATGTNALGTMVTDEFGYYIFNDLNAGDYVVGFSNFPAGYSLTPQNAGTNFATDSDPSLATGKTAVINLSAGEHDMTIDAGIFNPTANVGALGNKVWFDRDEDGIQDATENGVPGVIVTLYAADGTTVLATTSTDAAGNYLFPNLAGATYIVGFSNLPPNYALTAPLQGGNTALDSDPNRTTQKTGPITLAQGEVNLTVDAGIIESPGNNATASLGDLVWLDTNQDGIQDPGELGVAGVTVTLYDAVTNAVLGTKTTDALGNYIFTGLQAGSYKVGFTNIPAGFTFSGANQGTNDSTDADADASTSGMTGVYYLAAGQENLTVDAGIYPAPNLASLGNYVWNDLNLDGVQDPNEPGVAGVTVRLYDAADNLIATTSTDANGAYQFTGLTPGGYYVEFSNLPAGFDFTDANAGGNTQDNLDSDADPLSGATPIVTLSAGQNYPDLDAGIFSEKAGLGNYVWNDLNNDGIQDPNEEGIPGITVTLYAADGVTPISATVTDANGAYTFVNLEPGTYVVGFSGLPIGSSFSSPLQGGNTGLDSDADPITGKTAPITLDAGDYNPTIDAGIHTSTGAGLGNYVWMDIIPDGVQGANEPGVGGVTVTLYNAGGVAIQSAITDQNGYYSFPDLDPGTYSVGFSTLPSNVYFTTSNAGTSDAFDSDIDPATITVDGSGYATGGSIPQVTLAAGEYNPTLDAGLKLVPPAGTAQLGNYVWNDLNKDGIQDANEVGVAGITVTLFDSYNNVIGTTITDAYGYYLFNPLHPGDYHVGFTLPANYVFTTQNTPGNDATDSDVDPATGMTGNYTLLNGDINLTVDAGIYFQQPTTASVGNYVWYDTNQDGIQDPGEEGISGVTVTLYDNAGNVVGATVTDANGFYLFTNVTPGDYTVGFTPPAGLAFSPNNGGTNDPSNSDANPLTGMTSSFTVNAGDAITYVDAGLYSLPVNVGGLGDQVWYDINQNGVQDAGETGVSGVTVTLYAGDGTTVLATTTTDPYGNYIFNNLPQGQYVVGFTNLPAGYVLTTTAGTDSVTNSDANTTTALTPVITLGQGQFNMTYDAGIYNTNVANTNSIGDFVWNDLNKDGIQDPTEPGVAGITVTLYDATGAVVAVTYTDATGAYLFPDLPNGTYSVGFSNLPEGFVFSPTGAGTSATDSDPNPSTGMTAPVTLSGGTHITTLDAGINLGDIKIGKGTLGDLVWYDLDNNGLQDPGESGVQGVTVTLYAGDGTTPLATTITDALGNYIFTGLDAGNYVVGFTDLPAGFTISPKNSDNAGINGLLNSDVNPSTLLTDVVTLGPGEDKMSVDMGIAPPTGSASLGNFVWFDLNNDGLQTSGEPGVQGVMVTLYDNLGNEIGVTTTDANGEYYFIGLAPGTYNVGFNNLPVGYNLATYNADGAGINGTSNSDADPANGNKTATVTLVAGDNNLNLDAGIVSSTVASVGDYVWYDMNHDGIQDANEPGIGGVLVTLYNSNGVPVASAITNPAGGYIFTNVTPGDYTIGFSNIPGGMEFTTQETNPTSNTGSNADPVTGMTPSFTVVAGTHNPTIDAGLSTPILAGLGNYVWNDFNGNGLQEAGEPGVPGVVVTLYAADGTTILATAVTDGNGAYSFTNLPAGTYVVGFDNFPTGLVPTQIVGGLNGVANSDMDSTTQKTPSITLVGGEYNPNVDAGLYKPTSTVPASALIATSATIKGEAKCEIFWYTIEEMNTNNFFIERSIDGTSFTKVGTHTASGNTHGKTDYNFLDDIKSIENLPVIYYRIKMNDIDGRYQYSNVVTVKPIAMNGENVAIYPTPFTDKLVITYKSTGASQLAVQLTDEAGKVIRKQLVDLESGINTITLNELQSLSSSTYFLKLTDLSSGEIYVRKVAK